MFQLMKTWHVFGLHKMCFRSDDYDAKGEYASDDGGKDLSEKNNVVGEISIDDSALAFKAHLK